jgi:two-component system nitrogen regulation sensor histidine kinase NtrY
MLKKFIEKFKGDRKFFSIVFFVLIIIGISGIITEKIIDDTIDNWNTQLTKRMSFLEESVRKDYILKQDDLLLKIKNIRRDLRRTLQPENESYKELVKLVNHEKFDNYSIEIFAPNGKLIAWNQLLAINQNELFPLNFPLGETYFLSNYLLTFLTIVDTVHIQNDIFYLTVSRPIEKKYELANQYYKQISFANEISTEYQNEFEVDYSPYAETTKDGRKYSFELTNNKDKKIGVVTFTKPSLTSAVNNIKDESSKIQSLLIFLAILFAGLGLRGDFKKLESKTLKFFLWLIYLSLLRSILFFIGLPSKLIASSLTDPSFFSSAFAWGIVKSPLELLTTTILVIILAIQFFKYSRQYFLSDRKSKSKLFRLILSVVYSILIFLLIRGMSAAIRSVIFDSTIRYFKEPNILPDLPSLVMNLNILLLGFAIVLVIVGLINLISKYLLVEEAKVNKIKLSLIFLVITVIVFLSFYISNDPLITPFFLSVFLILIYLLHYQIIIKIKNSVYGYLFALLIGSLISITLLNYFNTKLERESLKTTAIEINRADENFLNFMIDETLHNAIAKRNILQSLGNKYENFDALAFSIWSRSSMQRESMNSGIRFYDRTQNILGGYQVGLNPDKEIFKYVKDDSEPNIVELRSKEDEANSYFEGIIKLKEREITKGYITAFASFDIESIGASDTPDFIKSDLSIFNRVIDAKQLKIFQFIDSKLAHVYGDIYPSRDQIKQIIQTQVDSNFVDTWLKLNFEGETYETYLLKGFSGKDEMITTVSVAERAFSWDLFNFFKIFIVHSLFIVLAFFIIVLSRLGKLSSTFKSKLLLSFLFISIIPVVILAIYNSQVVNERGKEGIFNELSQRSDYLEKHLKSQLQTNKNSDIIKASQNASKQLGISFAIYSSTDQIYNSQDLYNRIGFFNRKLNAKIYYYLNYLRYKEYMISESVDNFKYDNYYKYITLGGQDYILSVNDAFNRIKISSSTIEINVVIFGIYSFAVIIIIIISTFFANKISQPIQRLTKAAEAIGKGDLNIKIDHNERGEIKELLDGFNSMTSELKKNQIELAEMEREAAWKEMAKQVAHEIKNPLTPMKLALQQLIISYKDKSHDFDKLFEKVSQTVLNQIDNLNQIASEFSRFAKMPSLNIELVDLITSLNDTVNMFVHEKTSIKINTELSKAEIEADVSQLRRMLINLIRNSIQAGAIEITIDLTRQGNSYQMLFSDNGDGIEISDREKIFDENFTTKKQGMGLGLSLAKRFLESINGEIKLDASSTKGTAFKITIPVYQNQTISSNE